MCDIDKLIALIKANRKNNNQTTIMFNESHIVLNGLYALKEKQAKRWIPVSERLPELDKSGYIYVLVCMDDKFITATDYTHEGWGLWQDSGEVTHWMPLPAEPKEV